MTRAVILSGFMNIGSTLVALQMPTVLRSLFSLRFRLRLQYDYWHVEIRIYTLNCPALSFHSLLTSHFGCEARARAPLISLHVVMLLCITCRSPQESLLQ